MKFLIILSVISSTHFFGRFSSFTCKKKSFLFKKNKLEIYENYFNFPVLQGEILPSSHNAFCFTAVAPPSEL